MRVFILMVLLTNLLMAQVGVYRTDDILNKKGDKIGENYYNSIGEHLKKVVYDEYDGDKPISAKLYEVTDRDTLIGQLEFYYSNNQLMLVIEKDKNDEVVRFNWFYEKNGEMLEEVRDNRNNIVRYYSHSEEGFEDVTKRVLEENNLDKLVIIENDIIRTLNPLESLEDLLMSNKGLELAQTLKTLDMTYGDRTEILGAQIIVDGVKDYTGVEAVIMPGLSFKGRLDIGTITYEQLTDVIVEEQLHLVTISGKKLIELVENFLQLPPRHREFMHTAGLTFERDRDGELSIVKVEGSAVNPIRDYTLVVPQYVAEGNGIYYGFMNEKKYDIPYYTSIIVANYLEELKLIDDSYVLEKRHN